MLYKNPPIFVINRKIKTFCQYWAKVINKIILLLQYHLFKSCYSTSNKIDLKEQ